MKITNIAGYKFLPLEKLDALQDQLQSQCHQQALFGTILLSQEGINMNLAGEFDKVSAFLAYLRTDSRFANISFHTTYSDFIPFRHLKIKIKKEIITLKEPNATPNTEHETPRISAQALKSWLDENRDITLLDTRNDYEFDFGTFVGAQQLNIKNFSELPKNLSTLDKSKPLVMFCTGGIRCEKAGLVLLDQGFEKVYQLDGGILAYFAKVGSAHYQGDCFVFDERIALNTQLECAENLSAKQN